MMILLKKLFNWGVVQPAERVAVNHEVAGSSPATPATDKKGEEMSTTDTQELMTEIGKLRMRLSDLVDELNVLTNEVRQFKKAVAQDVQHLTERLDNRQGGNQRADDPSLIIT